MPVTLSLEPAAGQGLWLCRVSVFRASTAPTAGPSPLGQSQRFPKFQQSVPQQLLIPPKFKPAPECASPSPCLETEFVAGIVSRCRGPRPSAHHSGCLARLGQEGLSPDLPPCPAKHSQEFLTEAHLRVPAVPGAVLSSAGYSQVRSTIYSGTHTQTLVLKIPKHLPCL